MGPRPPDFDEDSIRQSPTFVKWMGLHPGQTLRYACRDFIKDYGEDEERLMRRIMIARRNNKRDHETLKRARRATQSGAATKSEADEPPTKRRRSSQVTLTDAQAEKEMDVAAVEATRSYRAWAALQDGQEFVYNQKYIKGSEGHDWLLRKHIWRRMRYRRENKKMVERMIRDGSGGEAEEDVAKPAAAKTVKKAPAAAAVSSGRPGKPTKMEAIEQQPPPPFADPAAVEAAMKAQDSFTAEAQMPMQLVHNPLDAVAAQAALDAAAQLAAAAVSHDKTNEEEENGRVATV
jgi:hypothetical protein